MSASKRGEPRILVFSSNPISDMGIDLAGSSHLEYSPSVQVIAVPCSSGVDPGWIVHALQTGFDGVFVSVDGNDCAYLSDCLTRTGRVVAEAQNRLRKLGLNPARVKSGGICSVCAEVFVNQMGQFGRALSQLTVPAEG